MNSKDEAWLTWIEAQNSATKIWIEQGPTEAIAALQHFLDRGVLSVEMQREFAAFRASLFDDLGDSRKAEEDFLAAHHLARLHELEKYSIEISLAALFKRNNAVDKAEEWYLKALESASTDRGVSGAGTLYQLIKLRDNPHFEGRERYLAETVVKQAWQLLELQGEPNLNQLGTSIQILLEAEQGPRSRIGSSELGMERSEAQELDVVLKKIAAALDSAAELASKAFAQDDFDHFGREIGGIRGETFHLVHKDIWEKFPGLTSETPADNSEQVEGGSIADHLEVAARNFGAAAQVFESKRSELEQLRDMVNDLRRSRGFL